jgi:hypothetical protein
MTISLLAAAHPLKVGPTQMDAKAEQAYYESADAMRGPQAGFLAFAAATRRLADAITLRLLASVAAVAHATAAPRTKAH